MAAAKAMSGAKDRSLTDLFRNVSFAKEDDARRWPGNPDASMRGKVMNQTLIGAFYIETA